MEKELQRLHELAYSRFLTVQKLHRLVSSDLFERAFALADDTDRKKIIELTESSNLLALKPFITAIGRRELSDKTITELRALGRKYGVKHYNNLPKTHLIEGIEDGIRAGKNQNIPRGDATLRTNVGDCG